MITEPPERLRPQGRIQFLPGIATVLLLLSMPIAVFAASGSSIDIPLESKAWLVPGLLGMVLCIGLNAVAIGSVIAFELVRPAHQKLFDKESREHRRLERILSQRPAFIAAGQLAAHTFRCWLVLFSVMPAPYLAEVLAGQAPSWLQIVGVAIVLALIGTTINVVVAEIAPRAYASSRPARAATMLYPFGAAMAPIFGPIGKVLVQLGSLITSRFGVKAGFVLANETEEEIKNLVESAEQKGEIETEERQLLHSVFEFGDTVVREVMTPRVDMNAKPIDCEPSEVLKLIRDSGHSRIPLYESTDDQILGIIHAKDLLMAMIEKPNDVDLRKLMRPALFVPENKPVNDLLREMKQNRTQLAVVQDEFGGTAGIVTIEDIVEELVGDIVDEYDVEEPELVKNGAGYMISGKANLYDVNEEIGSSFQSEQFDTLGGFVFGLFGRQPKAGETIEADGYRFSIKETDGRRVQKLYVEPLPEPQATASG